MSASLGSILGFAMVGVNQRPAHGTSRSKAQEVKMARIAVSSAHVRVTARRHGGGHGERRRRRTWERK
jgi:hypothetical protein